MSSHGFHDAEKAQCVIWVAEGHGYTASQRKFRKKYQKNPPDRSSIRRWYEQYQSRGSHSHLGGNGRPQISDEKKEMIRSMFNENPTVSLRTAATQVGVHHTTIWSFLRRELKLYPYKLQMAQQLSEEDETKRINFARYCRAELRFDSEFLKRVVFTDECKFSLSGFVNKQNCRIWGSERPNEVYQTPHNSPSVMVWCGVSKNEIIGPYFFGNETVTGESYKKLLRYYAFPKLRDYPDNTIFQQDGAPPHYAVPVRQYLDKKYPNKWMGRGGPILWPPRSPDLTPCDYFLWGYLKDIVYRTRPTNISELKTKIRDAVSTIDEDTLQKVFKNMENRICFVLREKGGHFEHLLN